MSEKFGLDKDIAQRLEDKFDPDDEQKVIGWIASIVGLKLDCLEELKSGVHLCLVAESISPGVIDKKKLNRNPKHYLEEHVGYFL
jgi:hypothetical protein